MLTIMSDKLVLLQLYKHLNYMKLSMPDILTVHPR